jgi:TolB-like protein
MEQALEKEPDRRYRSAADLRDDLRRIQPADVRLATTRRVPVRSEPPSSIVVLPFVDMSPLRDQEYFCHGITEEIIATLTRVPGLRVISRTSAFAFQDKALDVTEIGRRLRVGTALEGSLRKAGNRVRHRTTGQRAGRLPALVQAIRSRAVRRVRDPGRDSRGDRS